MQSNNTKEELDAMQRKITENVPREYSFINDLNLKELEGDTKTKEKK